MMAVLLVLIGALPTLLYNKVRMGSPFSPATLSERYAKVGAGNSLTGSFVDGLFGLIISPNRGLFEFCPLCILLFTLPLTWRRWPISARQLTWTFAVGIACYVLMLSKMVGWGAFGWGPRYLVPMLPAIFFPIAMSVQLLWDRHKRIVLPLIVLSVMLNGMAVFVNWHLASTEDTRVTRQWAMLPYQQMAVWRGLGLALHGKPLPAPPAIVNDDIRAGGARFPDLWEFRLMERSKAGTIVGLTAFVILLGLSGITCLRLLIPRHCEIEGERVGERHPHHAGSLDR